MMSENERLFIRTCVGEIGLAMRRENPRLALGEIYDAIAEELERRCRFLIDMQSQQQMGNRGPFNEGGE